MSERSQSSLPELSLPYYLKSILLVIDAAFEYDSHLFLPVDIALIKRLQSTSLPAQRLFARMFFRRGPWFQVRSLQQSYGGEFDVATGLRDLQELHLVEDDSVLMSSFCPAGSGSIKPDPVLSPETLVARTSIRSFFGVVAHKVSADDVFASLVAAASEETVFVRKVSSSAQKRKQPVPAQRKASRTASVTSPSAAVSTPAAVRPRVIRLDSSSEDECPPPPPRAAVVVLSDDDVAAAPATTRSPPVVAVATAEPSPMKTPAPAVSRPETPSVASPAAAAAPVSSAAAADSDDEDIDPERALAPQPVSGPAVLRALLDALSAFDLRAVSGRIGARVGLRRDETLSLLVDQTAVGEQLSRRRLDVLMGAVRGVSGRLVRLLPALCRVLALVQRVFFLVEYTIDPTPDIRSGAPPASGALRSALLADISRLRFAAYTVRIERRVWADRIALGRYEAALQLGAAFEAALARGVEEEVTRLLRRAVRRLQREPQSDADLAADPLAPVYARFTAAHVYARIVSHGVGVLERGRHYASAIEILRDLLKQPRLPHKHGLWYDRLTVNLCHLKKQVRICILVFLFCWALPHCAAGRRNRLPSAAWAWRIRSCGKALD
jgi:hypothetical protein